MPFCSARFFGISRVDVDMLLVISRERPSRKVRFPARPNRNRLEYKQAMATDILSPTYRNRSTRRAALGGALVSFAAAASAVGSGAGAAASVADLVPADADVALLALRTELLAAAVDVNFTEVVSTVSDERIDQSRERLSNVCWEIVDADPARTPAGRALKAAAAMHQLRTEFNNGNWRSNVAAMAWDVLSEIAGPAYQPPALTERMRALCEPERV